MKSMKRLQNGEWLKRLKRKTLKARSIISDERGVSGEEGESRSHTELDQARHNQEGWVRGATEGTGGMDGGWEKGQAQPGGV